MHPRSRILPTMEWPSIEALNADRETHLQALGAEGAAAKTELWDIELVADPGDEGYQEPQPADASEE